MILQRDDEACFRGLLQEAFCIQRAYKAGIHMRTGNTLSRQQFAHFGRIAVHVTQRQQGYI